jgi:hydroxypyruvate isomerase
MPRFSANLSLLFGELPFLERFEAARRQGFEAVEFQFPYEHDPAALLEVTMRTNLEVVLFNLPAGDWAAGERGIACLPHRVEEFRAGVARGIEYAQALGCTRLNCLAGISPAGVPEAECRGTLIDNLRFAAGRLKAEGIRLLLEPINTRDVPGFFVSRPRQALGIIEDARCDNLFLQYDIYHAQVMEGDLANTIAANLPRIGHMQLADNPGRHEPGTGEIRFPFLFEHIDRLGYQGWIGCEYLPLTTTEASFAWMSDVPSTSEAK